MALGGILIEAGIGPLADSGLNKAFGFAVGAWSVDAGANMFKLEFAASGGEAVGVEAGTIVGHDAAHYDAKTCEVQHRFPKKLAGGRGGFIRQHSGESHAGMVVDGDIKKFPTGSAGFVLRITGHSMAGLGDACEFFDVDMQEIPGMGMFVTDDGNLRFQLSRSAEITAP